VVPVRPRIPSGLFQAAPGAARRIPFNKPFIAGKELYYIAQAVTNGKIAADGEFTLRCSEFIEQRWGIHKALMTPSCTAALEMAMLLSDLGPGDEVIMPSFSFVSTANAVARVGATPVFVDIRPDTLNIDEQLIEAAITERTRAILVVHYAGVGCEMDAIGSLARKYGLKLIEDAAQAVDGYYRGKALGGLGHIGAYSFHETKNVICGEGGALCINDPALTERAHILRDKGTNRQAFYRGAVDKYTWVDIGSSYVPSEITSAFLWGQLEQLPAIAARRKEIHTRYADKLADLAADKKVRLPVVPENCTSNCHMFYILLPSVQVRTNLIAHLRDNGILAVFHFVPLHSSPMGRKLGRTPGPMPNTDSVSAHLLRLPFYYDLTESDQDYVIDEISRFCRQT
jgi:dTDP-4-amino-4,6-dideoxygalactose transaminase